MVSDAGRSHRVRACGRGRSLTAQDSSRSICSLSKRRAHNAQILTSPELGSAHRYPGFFFGFWFAAIFLVTSIKEDENPIF
jgi:hypothetical protein